MTVEVRGADDALEATVSLGVLVRLGKIASCAICEFGYGEPDADTQATVARIMADSGAVAAMAQTLTAIYEALAGLSRDELLDLGLELAPEVTEDDLSAAAAALRRDFEAAARAQEAARHVC